MRAIAALALCFSLAAPAFAEAPQPQKPMDPARYSGRYYEIARFRNANQRDCQAPVYDWSRRGPEYSIALTCRQGSPAGRASVRRASARIIDARTNAKLRVSFLGGLKTVEYRVIDHAPNWVLMGTAGGNYLWLLARTPNLPPASRDAAIARARALGYDVGRFEFPRHG